MPRRRQLAPPKLLRPPPDKNRLRARSRGDELARIDAVGPL